MSYQMTQADINNFDQGARTREQEDKMGGGGMGGAPWGSIIQAIRQQNQEIQAAQDYETQKEQNAINASLMAGGMTQAAKTSQPTSTGDPGGGGGLDEGGEYLRWLMDRDRGEPEPEPEPQQGMGMGVPPLFEGMPQPGQGQPPQSQGQSPPQRPTGYGSNQTWYF